MIDYSPMMRFNGTRRDHDLMVTTVCRECAVGCGLCAYVSEGRLIDVQGDEGNPVSEGRLCARGASFVRDLYHPERLAKPMDRTSLLDDFRELDSREEALDLLADRLKKIRDQQGPESLLIECHPAAGLDFYFAARRFAALWGTPYVYSPLDDPKSSLSTGVRNTPDSPCLSWTQSRCLFIIGADPAATHPVAFRWILKAQKNGTDIVVADTRFTKTMSKADFALRIRPDTANLLGMALMKAILEDELPAVEGIGDRFGDAEAWRNSFEGMSLEAAAEIIGLPSMIVKETARLLSKRGPVQVITGKPLAHLPAYGIWRTMATAMGWTGKPGGGWYPLDSGLPPLSSSTDVQAEGQPAIASAGQANAIVSMHDLLCDAATGRTDGPKAIICSGDCLGDLPLAGTPHDRPAGLRVYFGLRANKTSSLSHMVFPAQAWAERNGLFFSNDRAMLWGRKIVEPPEQASSGLDFWMGLAGRLGWEEQFPWKSDDGSANHEAFYEWLLGMSPLTKGCRPEALRTSSDCGEMVFWPFQGQPSTAAIPASLVSGSGTIFPTPAGTAENAPEEPDELYPLHIETPDPVSCAAVCVDSRLRNDRCLVQINPETAGALGIGTGDDVLVHEPRRITEARAWVTRMVPRWLVYLQGSSNEKRALVCKKGQSSQEALTILRELLS